jgi:HlyD family secretion protein
MKKIIWSVVALLAVFVIYNGLFASRRARIRCFYGMDRLTVSSVDYGLFTEFIPQTGVVSQDTVAHTTIVKVAIDDLYSPRIVAGLTATTTVNNTDHTLEITNVYTTVTNGRFDVDMVFKGETPPDLADGKTLRLRIVLGSTAEALLVPVGGFYKDTGGAWMYVVEGEDRAVKRRVKLGRKNTESFEVLDGLKAGDQVITSSYENFGDQESFDVSDMKEKLRS